MIETQFYQQFIADNIKQLPLDALEEVADFVVFLQEKLNKKQGLMQEKNNALLLAELHLLNHQQQQHLEQEFMDYEQQ